MALAIDASSPGVATNAVNNVAALASVSFTPPASSLLVILWSGDEQNLGVSASPTITDSLGTHLTYTLRQWKANGQGAPAVNGQAAIWTAPVTTSAAMTVTVTNNSLGTFKEAALRILVLTDTGQPTVGTSTKGGQSSGTAVPMAFTATQTGSWGFAAICDWDAVATESAGSGTTLISSSLVGGIVYGDFRRTTADGTNGSATTLNATLSVASANLAWTAVEILASAAGATVSDGYKRREFWPGRGPHRGTALGHHVTYFSTDTVSTVPIVDSDTATFTDVVSAQTRTDTDTGTFTDTVSAQTRTDTDTGIFTDVVSAQTRTDTDTAVFTETTLLSIPITDADTATFTDRATDQTRTASDTGTFTDTVSAQTRTDTDTGTFADTVSAQTRTAADTAVFTETTLLAIPVTDTDTGTFTDTVSAQTRTDTDTGIFTDVVSAQTRTASDTGTFTEGQSLNTGATPISDADSLTITDAPSTRSAALSATESAGWTDAAGALSAALSGADTAALTDLRGSTSLSAVESLALADLTGARLATLIDSELLSILDAGSQSQVGLSPLVYYGSTSTVSAGRDSTLTVTADHTSDQTVSAVDGSSSTVGGTYGATNSVTPSYDSTSDTL